MKFSSTFLALILLSVSSIPTLAEQTQQSIEIQLQLTDTASVASTLSQIYRDEIMVAADVRNSSLILRGPESLVTEAKKIVERLDAVPGRNETPAGGTVASTFTKQNSWAYSLPTLSLLKPLWPLQKKRLGLLDQITRLEMQLVGVQQPVEVPIDADPIARDRASRERERRNEQARHLQERIDPFRAELKVIDEQIALVKKKLGITGNVVALRGDQIVEISVGHDHGVRNGMRFQISDKEAHSGRVEVTKTEAKRSFARIIQQETDTPIRPRHQATMRIDDRTIADLIGHDVGEPIYNERLRRFKFRLTRIPVRDCPEIAEEFWMRYVNQGNPPIVSVFGDPRTNSLVVVGPPEADQAIRIAIAEWEGLAATGIDSQKMGDDSFLKSEQRKLRMSRRTALEGVVSRKLDILDAEAEGEMQNGSRLTYLNYALQSKMAELELIERKLKVIRDSFKSLEEQSSSCDRKSDK